MQDSRNSIIKIVAERSLALLEKLVLSFPASVGLLRHAQ
jgi:hypothetical protein